MRSCVKHSQNQLNNLLDYDDDDDDDDDNDDDDADDDKVNDNDDNVGICRLVLMVGWSSYKAYYSNSSIDCLTVNRQA